MSEFLSPLQAMKLAISEGEMGAGFVAPNPLVGCVILDSKGQLIAKGYHAKIGGAHAEVHALASITNVEQLKDAVVYVTLEPCSHHGRTPPCAERLVQLPIKKVVFGLIDPNPKVAGKGVQFLRAAGIEVEQFDQLQDELEDLAEIFFFNQKTSRAFTAIKVATTLDGQMAEASGESRWITGEDAREHVHFLRGSYDAIAIGRRTFEADNPRLNVRHANFPGKLNRVFVIDPDAQALPRLPDSELFKSHRPENIIWVTRQPQAVTSGIENWVVPYSQDRGFDWDALCKLAFDKGIYSIMVEGGAGLIGHLLANSAAQRWYQFLAPDLMGSKQGLSVGAHWGQGRLAQRLKLLRPRWRSFGRDLLLSGRLPQG